ncbi:MAG: hypothetical protein ACLSAP_01685 [Oscillospiraceae bacterium]
MDKKDYESLEGCVEGIIYRNVENGFTVFELSHEEELITVVGEMADIAEGEELKLMGYYTTHATFGHQFKACICERTLPSTANAIYKYLASGAVKGIGPKTARKIVDAFGDDTIHILKRRRNGFWISRALHRKRWRRSPRILNGFLGFAR